MKISGIYKIQSKAHPNRIYIGSAVNIKYRWHIHLLQLREDKHCNHKLQRHFNKYGEIDLLFSILFECGKIDLLKHEQFFIDSLDPYFNICKKAGSSLGVRRSYKTRRRISKSWLIRALPSKETCEKIGRAQLGRKRTLITRSKMSEKRKLQIPPMLGKKHSEETKKLMSLKAKARKNWKGRKLSEEHKRNILIARQKYFENKKLKSA